MAIGVFLSKEERPIVYFSEKLNDAKEMYSYYDKEFYAIIHALKKWRHYLMPKEFIFYANNHALEFITRKEKLNQRHVKWVEYMKNCTFFLKHISRKTNKVSDSLSRRCLVM